MTEAFKNEKLREVVMYLVYLSGKSPEKLGKTRIAKILWFFEGLGFLMNRERPLGLKFEKRLFGPYPVELDRVLEELQKENKLDKSIRVQDWRTGRYVWLYRAKAISELKWLEKHEIVLLSGLYEHFIRIPARYLSDWTHNSYYERKSNRESMNPLSVLFLFRRKKPSKSAIEWAKREVSAIKEGKEKTPHTEELERLVYEG